MISINATLILQVLHFLVLVFVLDRLMFRPILKSIRDRNLHFEKTQREIENLHFEASRLKEECQARETGIKEDAVRRKSQLLNEGLAEANRFSTGCQKEIMVIKTEANEHAVEELKKARPSLDTGASSLAEEIISKILGRSAGQ